MKDKLTKRLYDKNLYRTSWKRRFTIMLERAQNRSKKRNHPQVTLTIRDLLELLKAQDNKDFYTGRELDLTQVGNEQAVSLDRLDSTKPYEKGNVVLTTWGINKAKQRLSVEEFVEQCKEVIEHKRPDLSSLLIVERETTWAFD